MELSPIEFTGRALKIFDDATRLRLESLRRAAPKGQAPDVHALLGYLLDNLDFLFRDEVQKRDARSYIHELRSVRNKWAHSEPLDYDDAFRAADTVARLGKLLGSEHQAADALKRELRSLTAQNAIYHDHKDGPRPTAGNWSRAAVIACSKTKLNKAAAAIDLYTGPLFRSSVDVAKSEGLPILVLSTLYGLLDPTDVVEPYELSYEAMTPTEREKLVGVLASQFAPFLVAGLREALVLGGQNYRFLIGQALKGTSAKVNQHPKWRQVYKQFYR